MTFCSSTPSCQEQSRTFIFSSTHFHSVSLFFGFGKNALKTLLQRQKGVIDRNFYKINLFARFSGLFFFSHWKLSKTSGQKKKAKVSLLISKAERKKGANYVFSLKDFPLFSSW
jgi:hypothetical protein